MNGREFYKKTFDEIQLSDQAMTRLMLVNNTAVVCRQQYPLENRILKAAVAFLGFLLASGTVFSVPLL